jgi:hypothetical protein
MLDFVERGEEYEQPPEKEDKHYVAKISEPKMREEPNAAKSGREKPESKQKSRQPARARRCQNIGYAPPI